MVSKLTFSKRNNKNSHQNIIGGEEVLTQYYIQWCGKGRASVMQGDAKMGLTRLSGVHVSGLVKRKDWTEAMLFLWWHVGLSHE